MKKCVKDNYLYYSKKRFGEIRERIIKSRFYPNAFSLFVDVGYGEGCLSTPNGRYILEGGVVSVSAVKTAKFGKQVQIQAFSPNPPVFEPLRSGKYYRCELFLPLNKLGALLSALLKLELELKVKGWGSFES